MTTVYFVRHAEPNYANHDDLTRELSPRGWADRRLVTEFFADMRIDAVLSSPFQRARDTVGELAERRGLPLEIVDDFRERRVDHGWIEDFDAFAQAQWADFSYQRSDGECLRDVQRRNIAALQHLLDIHRDQTVVVGSHGTALSTIIHYYDPCFGYDEFEKIRRLMPWIVRFQFADAACVDIEAYDLHGGTKRYSPIFQN